MYCLGRADLACTCISTLKSRGWTQFREIILFENFNIVFIKPKPKPTLFVNDDNIPDQSCHVHELLLSKSFSIHVS